MVAKLSVIEFAGYAIQLQQKGQPEDLPEEWRPFSEQIPVDADCHKYPVRTTLSFFYLGWWKSEDIRIVVHNDIAR